ncbi:hypothetical protein DFJ73DRAFT_769769 [Zopfochytrium polystomum]|nr:hypothetical protein DFJ73DRAFT_769769 [Zopfochytrium polystomum]
MGPVRRLNRESGPTLFPEKHKIGNKVSYQGESATVYHAKHGSNDVIYKQDSYKSRYEGNGVAATKADSENIPEAKSKYLLKGENAKDHPNKAKLSDTIYSQLEKNQKDVGFLHNDVHAFNIRVHASPSDKPVELRQVILAYFPKNPPPFAPRFPYNSFKTDGKIHIEGQKAHDLPEIQDECGAAGFQFLTGRELFRRTAVACRSSAKRSLSRSNSNGGGGGKAVEKTQQGRPAGGVGGTGSSGGKFARSTASSTGSAQKRPDDAAAQPKQQKSRQRSASHASKAVSPTSKLAAQEKQQQQQRRAANAASRSKPSTVG